MKTVVYKWVVLSLALGLGGCATAPKPLYQWSNYQGPVYQYFKDNGASAAEQISLLEAQLQKNKAMGELSPPGLHAHLALLYSKLGNDGAARENLLAERNLFPESAPYIDFLLKNANRPKSDS
ncbi:hypothetical protein HNP55_001628 [Paucibacter oligotrophus]|uniref:DUF4810 domain-containing protein n=1 Tax=Roseateles oligotrophus TaxID=1769250 RepID=A0A840LAF4_9BURK|nr:DUF4810 domain-containing protein [Roseateles oligotrophus]MBB4843109.1 hypothetical protein [Roseateles oligotrophus]